MACERGVGVEIIGAVRMFVCFFFWGGCQNAGCEFLWNRNEDGTGRTPTVYVSWKQGQVAGAPSCSLIVFGPDFLSIVQQIEMRRIRKERSSRS